MARRLLQTILTLLLLSAVPSGLLAAPQDSADATSPRPQFEVASVKPNKTGEQPSNNWKLSVGRIDYHNSQVLQVIKSAWGDFSLRVEGAPGWLVGSI